MRAKEVGRGSPILQDMFGNLGTSKSLGIVENLEILVIEIFGWSIHPKAYLQNEVDVSYDWDMILLVVVTSYCPMGTDVY